MIGQGMEVRTQFGKQHKRIDRPAVLDNVEVAGREIHDLGAIWARDISVPNIPLAGTVQSNTRFPREPHQPRAGCSAEGFQRLPYAIASDAAANREELLDERHQRFSVVPETGATSSKVPSFTLTFAWQPLVTWASFHHDGPKVNTKLGRISIAQKSAWTTADVHGIIFSCTYQSF